MVAQLDGGVRNSLRGDYVGMGRAEIGQQQVRSRGRGIRGGGGCCCCFVSSEMIGCVDNRSYGTEDRDELAGFG